jgi:predicted peptidase
LISIRSLFRVVMAALVLALVPAMAISLEVKDDSLKPGKLIKKVVTLHDLEQSYALYLPSNYDASRKWPILYGFCPGGRGVNPVFLFKQAAEKYGWIVVGSNNSRNGPFEPILKAITSILKDTQARFSIDPTARYATGFSGGARTAFFLANRDKFVGVMPIGAGMNRRQKLPKKGQMDIFSMCGTNCFNHSELLRLEQNLNRAGVPNRMMTFKGGHTWAPPAMCGAALRYMELLRQCRAKKPDPKKISAMLDLEMADADAIIKTPGQYMRGYARLPELVGFIPELAIKEKLKQKLAAVENTEKFKKEKTLTAQLATIDRELLEVKDQAQRFSESLKRYRVFLEKSVDSDTALALTARIKVTGRSMAVASMQLMQMKRYKQAEVYLKYALLFAPQDKTLNYNLACVLAINGKKTKALDALEAAVKLGFDNYKHIKSDPDLKTLWEEKRYQELLKGEE